MGDDLAKALGLRIKALRGEGSQEDLARAAGVSVGTISRWERGIDSPRADKLAALADHFNTSADHLLLGAPHEPPAPNAAFHAFCATHLGRIAQERKLVRTLLAMTASYPRPPTVRTYEVLTSALLQDENDREE